MLLTLSLIGGPVPALDEHVRHWAVTHQNEGVRRVASHLVRCGDLRVGAAVVAIGAVAAARRRRSMHAVVPAMVVGAVSGVLVEVLKVVIGRSEAPTAAHAVLRAGGQAYPSGHVATASLCWGLAALLVGQAYPRFRRLVAGVAAVAVLGVAAGMVYGPGHWLTDVLGAGLLGVAAVAVCVSLLQRRQAS